VRIAIVGAGIGGLTLAAALRRRTPTAQIDVYERDDSPTARPQGYAIGLKQDGGLGVLADLGLRDAVLGGDTVLVTNFVFTDQRGRTLLALAAGADESRYTYRIQREHLKSVLRDGAAVHYGRRCTGYAGSSLLFDGADPVEADVIVGCDGVASALRAQVIGDDRNYLGLTAINGDAAVAPDHPLLAGGYFMTLGDDGSSIFCYAQPDGTTHFSYTVHAPHPGSVTDGLLDRVLAGVAGWHPLVQTIVGATDPDSLLVRDYYDREPTRTIRQGPVWLIGDAAHPMCPFQGQGANTAMRDAYDLATVLGAGASSAAGDPDAVAARIAARGRKAVLESRRAAAQFHTTSRFSQRNRDLGFRMANTFIKLGSRLHRRS
jgi:salicylate hydroxylase